MEGEPSTESAMLSTTAIYDGKTLGKYLQSYVLFIDGQCRVSVSGREECWD